MTAGFFGLGDFTGLPIGLGTAVPHSAFKGAGKHFYHSAIMAELEHRRLQDLMRKKMLAKVTQSTLSQKTVMHRTLQLGKAQHKRMVENAIYSLLLAEI